MSLLKAILRRFGYVKLTSYGLALTSDGRLVPAAAPGVWRAEDGRRLPLPAETFDLPTSLAAAALPLPHPPPPTTPAATTSSAPAAAPPRPAAHPVVRRAPSPAPVEREPAADEDDEWEWQIALARARARAEDQEHMDAIESPDADPTVETMMPEFRPPSRSQPPPVPPPRSRRPPRGHMSLERPIRFKKAG